VTAVTLSKVIEPSLKAACEARRARVSSLLSRTPAVVFAGSARPRNYLHNPYPFRASSHFLHLVGTGIEGACLLWDGARWILLTRDAAADDDLWHGPTEAREELSQSLGVPISDARGLSSLLQGQRPATLPAFDIGEGALRARALNRDPELLGKEELDLSLADALVQSRLVHDAAAIEGLRRAARASVRAHLRGLAATQPGLREQHVCATMEAQLSHDGCGTAYGSIVTVHGEVLHNHAHHHTLRAGDLLLADVGAETPEGYAGDITRTWPVSGRFSGTQRDLYQVVLDAQHDAISLCRPGTRYRDVHLAACRRITQGLVDLGILDGQVDALVEDGIHALFFPHGIGHLLGLDVHDMEDLGDRAGYERGRSRSPQFGLSYLRLDRDLAPGMAVTIEPGFYQVPSLLADPERVGLSAKALRRDRLAAFADVRGIRIEDDVLITAAGPEVLTAALPKLPEHIEALVGAH
jgi:Xaa-Pro aminopeptidase